MGGLPVQTPAHAALRAPMPKLSLPEYHPGWLPMRKLNLYSSILEKARGFGVNRGGDSSAVVPQPDR
jgi:hypothetical protein